MPALRAVADWRKLMAGDDIARTVTIYDGGSPYNFSSASLVQCAFTDGRTRQLIGPTAQNSGSSGANWASGILVVEFASTYTQNLIRGDVALEIQITMAGKKYSAQLFPLEVEVGIIP